MWIVILLTGLRIFQEEKERERFLMVMMGVQEMKSKRRRRMRRMLEQLLQMIVQNDESENPFSLFWRYPLDEYLKRKSSPLPSCLFSLHHLLWSETWEYRPITTWGNRKIHHSIHQFKGRRSQTLSATHHHLQMICGSEIFFSQLTGDRLKNGEREREKTHDVDEHYPYINSSGQTWFRAINYLMTRCFMRKGKRNHNHGHWAFFSGGGRRESW